MGKLMYSPVFRLYKLCLVISLYLATETGFVGCVCQNSANDKHDCSLMKTSVPPNKSLLNQWLWLLQLELQFLTQQQDPLSQIKVLVSEPLPLSKHVDSGIQSCCSFEPSWHVIPAAVIRCLCR